MFVGVKQKTNDGISHKITKGATEIEKSENVSENRREKHSKVALRNVEAAIDGHERKVATGNYSRKSRLR